MIGDQIDLDGARIYFAEGMQIGPLHSYDPIDEGQPTIMLRVQATLGPQSQKLVTVEIAIAAELAQDMAKGLLEVAETMREGMH